MIATGLWNWGYSEKIQANCFNCTKMAPCVLQDQSTDLDPSTIIAIQIDYVLIAKWLTGLQGDPPGCIRIGQITTHMNRTMWKQIQHQTAAEQQQTWTAVILIKESLCQIQVRRIKKVATIWHSMILNWTGQTKSWIISWFATSQAMHRFSSRCCSNWRIYWWLVLSAIHNPIAILCNPWN